MKRQNSEIGIVLRSFRKNRGLTLKQLAEPAGITASSLSQFENNKISPSIKTLAVLSEILRVPLADFFKNDAPASK